MLLALGLLQDLEKEQAAKKKGNIAKYQFWQHHNKPIELWSPKVIKQK
ncbi:hypothetical protein [uncultured Dokdonia sp.]